MGRARICRTVRRVAFRLGRPRTPAIAALGAVDTAESRTSRTCCPRTKGFAPPVHFAPTAGSRILSPPQQSTNQLRFTNRNLASHKSGATTAVGSGDGLRVIAGSRAVLVQLIAGTRRTPSSPRSADAQLPRDLDGCLGEVLLQRVDGGLRQAVRVSENSDAVHALRPCQT